MKRILLAALIAGCGGAAAEGDEPLPLPGRYAITIEAATVYGSMPERSSIAVFIDHEEVARTREQPEPVFHEALEVALEEGSQIDFFLLEAEEPRIHLNAGVITEEHLRRIVEGEFDRAWLRFSVDPL